MQAHKENFPIMGQEGDAADAEPPISTDELTEEAMAAFLELDGWDTHEQLIPAHAHPKIPPQERQDNSDRLLTASDALSLMRQAVRDLKDPAMLDKEVEEADVQARVQELESMLPDKSTFQAGMLQQRHAVWEEFLESTSGTGTLDKQSRSVMRIVKRGVKLDFVPIDHSTQLQMPAYKKKLRLVSEMLEKADRGGKSVAECLEGKKPSRVIFPNRISARQHSHFLEEEIVRLLACKSIKEWDWQNAQPPHIIHGLAVVTNRQGKLRMIVDARYLNAFLRYQAFHYEQLKDVLAYLGEGHYMASLDFTSGYHHLLVREEQQQYFGFAFQG